MNIKTLKKILQTNKKIFILKTSDCKKIKIIDFLKIYSKNKFVCQYNFIDNHIIDLYIVQKNYKINLISDFRIYIKD